MSAVPKLFVLGAEEMIESIDENLIDNAVSLTTPGSETRCTDV
jgi:hypothetical protein